MDTVDDVLATASHYRQLVINKDNAHYALAQRYTRRHTVLGVPVVITTAVVSTAIFASLAQSTSTGWRIATARADALAELAMLTEELDRLESAGRQIPEKLYERIRERFWHRSMR